MREEVIMVAEEVIKARTCMWSAPGDHPVGCGVILTIKDGKLEGIEGDPTHPITHGRLCPRCLAIKEAIEHPDRLRHPMKRAREDRGYDKWEQITWDEAYDIIENKARSVIDEYGPDSIFTLSGTGRETTLYAAAYPPLVFGSPNNAAVLSGASCYGPRCTIANYFLGAGYPEMDYAAYFPDRYDDPRYEIPKYILIWGKNPIYSNPDGFFGHAVVDLMKRGSKLIIIDPRVTWLAVRCEYHLQLRPGTDTALGLGLLNVIIGEDLYDHEFVENWCFGFEDLAEHVKQYPPEKVEEITWVPAETIRAAARAFATSHPSTGLWGLAIDQNTNGIQAGQCFLSLMAITGNFDVPGGVSLARPASFMGKWRYETIKTVAPENLEKRIVDLEGKYRLHDFGGGAMPGVLGDTLLNWLEMDNPPYPLKMAWLIGTNVLACMSAQPQRWMKALNKLDLIVANDVFMNPTIMALCDIVLPVSMSPEHAGVVMPHFGRNTPFLGALNKVLDPGDTKSDLQILMDIGKRLNPEEFPWDTPEDFLTEQLHTVYDWGYEDLSKEVVHQQEFQYRKFEKGLLRADGAPGFETATGKLELRSTIYPQFGIEALPYYEEPFYSPYSTAISEEEKKKYPFVLTTGGRNLSMFHSEHRQIPSLRNINPWPKVTINTAVAEEYGIKDGDWVRISNEFGCCVEKANVNNTVDPRVVHAEHAWWYPEDNAEAPELFGVWKSNINNLLPHECIGISGYGAPYKCLICNIEKVDSLTAEEGRQ